MNATQTSFDDPGITREEWGWVEELIRDVQRDGMRDEFAKNLFQWDLAVKQFRKLEQRRLLLQSPTTDDLRYHAICLHALLTIGHALVLAAKKFKPQDLTLFNVKQEELEAYVAELEHSLAEWHHGFSPEDVKKAQEIIFGGAA